MVMSMYVIIEKKHQKQVCAFITGPELNILKLR